MLDVFKTRILFKIKVLFDLIFSITYYVFFIEFLVLVEITNKLRRRFQTFHNYYYFFNLFIHIRMLIMSTD